MKALNTEQLAKIASKNKTSEAVFTSWAIRERNTDEIDVARTKNLLKNEGFKIVPEELVSTLKELERGGFGEFKLGKNGQPSRFRFNYSLKEIGKAGLGDMPKGLTRIPEAPLKKAVAKPIVSERVCQVIVILEGGRKATVEFPVKLSHYELQLIVNNIVEANNKA